MGEVCPRKANDLIILLMLSPILMMTETRHIHLSAESPLLLGGSDTAIKDHMSDVFGNFLDIKVMVNIALMKQVSQ